MKTLGFVVNPIAGMGGAVGLKGTDGEATLRKAVSLGATPVAPARAELFLSRLKPLTDKIRLLVATGMMGEYEAEKTGFQCTQIGEAEEETTGEDTKSVAAMMKNEGVDLLVFCGGDGTARDIMDSVDSDLPVLGVPTGVKMHSAVFALNPESAARISMDFLLNGLPLREAEVMDIDEDAFREGLVSAKLHGYMLVPYRPDLVQSMKLASAVTEVEMRNQAAIAVYLIDEILEPDVVYILGPGTTTRTITDLLDQKKTILGVDLLLNKQILDRDVNEKAILEKIRGKKAKIIVTPIGGQGFIFGRGNQQISASVVKELGLNSVIVIATKHKLRGLQSLKVDTGDPELDQQLRGHVKVIVDYRQEHLVRVE
jgi:predicted polyphosphate/ATP-dependent NAD kinase